MIFQKEDITICLEFLVAFIYSTQFYELRPNITNTNPILFCDLFLMNRIHPQHT